jgi:hypothetical protein
MVRVRVRVRNESICTGLSISLYAVFIYTILYPDRAGVTGKYMLD